MIRWPDPPFNDTDLKWDPQSEAGGGKVMDSSEIASNTNTQASTFSINVIDLDYQVADR